ncbi:DUF4157 domain-containing protein [Kutzneria sp. NPDC052558]|uniref:eCIS core domain-containing protein n=1 Tax=Kutzneria sp. NPDC052558 TaxID=3364121 RepID=UPI0037C51BA3
MSRRAEGGRAAAVPPVVDQALNSPGKALDGDTRDQMQAQLGQDLGGVRIHTGPLASASAAAVSAPAYTVGRSIVFGAGQYQPSTPSGRNLLAHELTHVVQQRGTTDSGPIGTGHRAAEREAHRVAGGLDRSITHTSSHRVLHRYESGEHVQFGETHDALAALVAKREQKHTVAKGETPTSIAAKYKMSEADLRTANANKLKTFHVTSHGRRRKVSGFLRGEVLTIPPQVNDAVKDALTLKELTMTVNGVDVSYGEGIAMGDMFRDSTALFAAPDTEVKELTKLIKDDRADPGVKVSNEQWNTATGGMYSELARDNEEHFAPSDPALVTPSGTGKRDHKAYWERFHGEALFAAQKGDKNKALVINAFADHFLTDAFSAGHLINKPDVMDRFDKALRARPNDLAALLHNVAEQSFKGPVKDLFSQYETKDKYKGVFHPNINSASRFEELLKAIWAKMPSVVLNLAADAAHATLNATSGGIPVSNKKGRTWNLTGDKTLDPVNRDIIREAVAQSQLNVLDAHNAIGPIDLPGNFARVWDYVPRPKAAGVTQIKKAVDDNTDPSSPTLLAAAVRRITSDYKVLLDEIVKRGDLRKA